MRTLGVVGSCIIFLCCHGASAPGRGPVSIAVVLVTGPAAPPLDGFKGLDVVENAVPGVELTVFGVESSENGRRMLETLRARGDSIVVALGRPMIPAVADVGSRWKTAAWLGFDDPGIAGQGVATWWASSESLRVVLAQAAARVEGSQVILVGASIPPGILRVFRERGVLVRPVMDGSRGPRSLMVSPDEVVFLVDPAPIPSTAWARTYWACESPFGASDGAVAALSMDWAAALTGVVQWIRGVGGLPPGPTLEPFLSLRLEAREVG